MPGAPAELGDCLHRPQILRITQTSGASDMQFLLRSDRHRQFSKRQSERAFGVGKGELPAMKLPLHGPGCQAVEAPKGAQVPSGGPCPQGAHLPQLGSRRGGESRCVRHQARDVRVKTPHAASPQARFCSVSTVIRDPAQPSVDSSLVGGFWCGLVIGVLIRLRGTELLGGGSESRIRVDDQHCSGP